MNEREVNSAKVNPLEVNQHSHITDNKSSLMSASSLSQSFISLKTLIVACLLLLLLLLALSAGVGYWIVENTQARFIIREQRGWVSFPESVHVGGTLMCGLVGGE